MSGLALAIAEVRAVPRGEPVVEDHRRTMLRFAAEHADALERSCLAGHFTGSAMVVDAGGERVLLMLHAKLGRWLQPGGHADGDGRLGRVARREAAEETGIDGLVLVEPPIDLDVHAIPARGDEPAHLHLDVRYVVRAPVGAQPRPNHESVDIGWFAPDQLDGLDVDPGLRRLARTGLALSGPRP